MLYECEADDTQEAMHKYIDEVPGFEKNFTLQKDFWENLAISYTGDGIDDMKAQVHLVNGLCKREAYKIKKIIQSYADKYKTILLHFSSGAGFEATLDNSALDTFAGIEVQQYSTLNIQLNAKANYTIAEVDVVIDGAGSAWSYTPDSDIAGTLCIANINITTNSILVKVKTTYVAPQPSTPPSSGGAGGDNDATTDEAGIVYSMVNSTTAQVSGYTGSDDKIVISADYLGYPVTIIAANAFENNDTITEIILPNSIGYIGDSAFDGCSALETIHYIGTPYMLSNIEIGDNNDVLNSVNYTYAVNVTCTLNSPTEGGEVPQASYNITGTIEWDKATKVTAIAAFFDYAEEGDIGSYVELNDLSGSTELDLRESAINDDLKFGNLAVGDHILTIQAKCKNDEAEGFFDVCVRNFTVKAL